MMSKQTRRGETSKQTLRSEMSKQTWMRQAGEGGVGLCLVDFSGVKLQKCP